MSFLYPFRQGYPIFCGKFIKYLCSVKKRLTIQKKGNIIMVFIVVYYDIRKGQKKMHVHTDAEHFRGSAVDL